MKRNSLRIGVLMGGASAERDISLKTGRTVCEALRRRGHVGIPIDVDSSLPHQLKIKKIQVAFLALHGPGGEDGTVQGMLEIMNIPYTGSGVSASVLGMDKGLSRMMFQSTGIRVPTGVTLTDQMVSARPPAKLGFPLVVKPCLQGSTIGVSIVRKASQWKQALSEAFRYGEHVVVEKYIAGREVAVGVFGEQIFPVVEVIVAGGFYDFHAKYGKALTQYVCPAPLSQKLERTLREQSFRAYKVLGCRGAARVDFRIHPRSGVYVLELNTIPGMTERSLLPMGAAQAGVSYDELVERMLVDALPKGLHAGALKTKSLRRKR